MENKHKNRKKYLNMEDKDLVELCINKPNIGYNKFYKKYYTNFYNFAKKYTINSQNLDEIISISFIKIFKKIHTLNDPKKLKSWCKIIIKNTSLNFIRENKKHEHLEFLDYMDFNDDEIYVDEYKGISNEKLHKLINELAPRYREVMIMYYFNGYSHQEISDICQLS